MDYFEIKNVDTEVYEAVIGELRRQNEGIELIASENFVSKAILSAQGSVLTNKYAEGYPFRRDKKTGEIDYTKNGRYYGGCECVNVVEKLAIERAKELFKAEHVNVQPHSGTQANMAVYFTILSPGDTIFGMDLSHGGHLSHGSPVNFSGIYYKVVHYGVDEKSETINYDNLHKLAQEHKPKLIMCGASAYPREIDFKKIKEIADEVGAYTVADIAHIAGLVATGYHPSPVPYMDFVTTTTHKTLRGPRGGMVMCKEKFAKDIDKITFPGIQGGPLMHVIAAKAICFKEALSSDYKEYIKNVVENAKVLAEELKSRGYHLVSGGTDNHLILLNLTNKGISGKKAERLLGEAGITVNKNTVPFDKRSPFITSGIRIGTPAVTTRGFGKNEMKLIADFIDRVLSNPENEEIIRKVKQEVQELCRAFPLYQD